MPISYVCEMCAQSCSDLLTCISCNREIGPCHSAISNGTPFCISCAYSEGILDTLSATDLNDSVLLSGAPKCPTCDSTCEIHNPESIYFDPLAGKCSGRLMIWDCGKKHHCDFNGAHHTCQKHANRVSDFMIQVDICPKRFGTHVSVSPIGAIEIRASEQVEIAEKATFPTPNERESPQAVAVPFPISLGEFCLLLLSFGREISQLRVVNAQTNTSATPLNPNNQLLLTQGPAQYNRWVIKLRETTASIELHERTRLLIDSIPLLPEN